MQNVACYDLARNPPTFDAVAFIVQVAEQFGDEPVRINIAPGPRDGFRDDKLWPQGGAARTALLRNIALPMFEMLPNATLHYGPREGWGAGDYVIPWKHFVRCNAKGIRPLRPFGPVYPRSPHLVTITLREAEHWPLRNSNLRAWLDAAAVMRDMGFNVIFVRDTHMAGQAFFQDGKPWRTESQSTSAATEIHARARLYRAARCNMFVSNGPAWLAMACDAPALILKPTCEALGRCYDSAWFKRCGIEPGGQFPGTAPHHRLVWEEDTWPNIVAAFRNFIARPLERTP